MKLEHERELNGLYLFKSLIKDGCKWQGDIMSKNWSESLYIPVGLEEQVELTLSIYDEGKDYKRDSDSTILIY